MSRNNGKDVTHHTCIICNNHLGLSTRNYIAVFEQKLAYSGSTLHAFLTDVLNIKFSKETHSEAMCKKCYKNICELDEMEVRMAELKNNMRESFRLAEGKKLGGTISVDVEANAPEKRKRGRKAKVINEEVCTNVVNVTHFPDFENVEEVMVLNGKDLDEQNLNLELIRPERVKVNKGKRANIVVNLVVSKNGKEHICLLCSPEEKFQADAVGIIQHAKQIHGISLYICDLCGDEFARKSALEYHLDAHTAPIPNEKGQFACDLCKRYFATFNEFRVHKRLHGREQNGRRSCDFCEKTFPCKSILIDHMNTHSGEKPHICSICGKKFASKCSMKTHEKTHKYRTRRFSCVNCGKSFYTQHNLIYHERIHSGIKNYICNQCGRSFGTARCLEQHFVIHTGYRPHICRLCGKSFSRKADIQVHERIHTGEKPYRCEFCGITFCQRSNLLSHQRTTHYDDKRYRCTDCNKAFKRRRLLDYHMKSAHTGERPFKCEVCGATFIYPEHFKKHKLIHTGQKPFECEVCGKAFNSRDNRNAHRFTHSDKKPYECMVCGLGFMRKPMLYNHMRAMDHKSANIIVNQPQIDKLRKPVLQVETMEMTTSIESGSGAESTSAHLTEIPLVMDENAIREFQEEHIVGLSNDAIFVHSLEEPGLHHLYSSSSEENNLVQVDERVTRVQICENEEDYGEGVSGVNASKNGEIQIIRVHLGTDDDEEMEDENDGDKHWFRNIQGMD